MLSTIKYLVMMLGLAILLLLFTLIVLAVGVGKDDVILKENNKEIVVKKYDLKVDYDNTERRFMVRYDSTLTTYPKNELFAEGIIQSAVHPSHVVRIKDTKTGKIIETPEDLMDCDDVETCNEMVGHKVKLINEYYPNRLIKPVFSNKK